MFSRFFFLVLGILIFMQYGSVSLAKTQDSPSLMQTLASLANLREFSVDTGIYFTEQNKNKNKNKILQEILLKYRLTEGILFDQSNQFRINLLSTKKPITIPNIEVRKIHAAKYRIRVHNARGNFPLNFNESFHKDWRLYIVPWSFKEENLDSTKIQQILSSYHIFKGNEKTQVSLKSLKDFLKKNLITDIEQDSPSLTNPYHFIKRVGQSVSDQKTPITGFISKKFFNTIQNENLPTGPIWETWFAGDIAMGCNVKRQNKENCAEFKTENWKVVKGFNRNVIEWPNLLHWRINAKTNGWWINSNFLRHSSLLKNNESVFYRLNPNGTLSFELVMEFWPQRLFYIGGITSITVLVISLTLLFIRHTRRKYAPAVK
jgi:hypothetical protein